MTEIPAIFGHPLRERLCLQDEIFTPQAEQFTQLGVLLLARNEQTRQYNGHFYRVRHFSSYYAPFICYSAPRNIWGRKMLVNQIIYLRKKAGMSQLQLAQQLNIGPSAIGMYEQGRRTPSIDILIQMSKLFNVSLDYLITGKEFPDSLTDENDATAQFTCPCTACPFFCNKLKLQRMNNCGDAKSETT